MSMGTEWNDFHTNQFLLNDKLVNPDAFTQQDQFLEIPFQIPYENLSPLSNPSPDGDSESFSDIALSYISQMLMEEDEKVDNFHESSALESTENSFYEILGKNDASESNLNSLEFPDSIIPNYGNSGRFNGSSSNSNSSGAAENDWSSEFSEHQLPVEFASQSSFGSDLFIESMPAWHFNRGVKEARKFLPSTNKLVIDLESPLESKEERKIVNIKSEKEEREHNHHQNSIFGSRGRKNPHSDDSDLEEGRSIKQIAVSSEGAIRCQMLDDALLCNGNMLPKAIDDLRESLHHVTIKSSSQSGQAKGPNSGKGRGKKQSEKEVVDLRTLLVHCAQMVSTGDQRSTNDLLKQIRQHSSAFGNGSQRIAHYFVNGLDARLAGTGRELYNSYRAKRRTTCDFLKAFQLYLAACPFNKISYFFSNQTILSVSEKAKKVHIVDFGIDFGFQWPSLIQLVSSKRGAGDLPKLKITGIDFPQPGFRPAERIEETGSRLAYYAERFNIPFEYKSIASKFEDIRIEDLDIDRDEDEVLIVNCLFSMKYLADETVVVDSPRNAVLNLIRKMNPDVFIHGIINGSYSAPFFVTRFREAMYHFSALYDMLETIVPREDEQRLLFEREIFGREVLNVIACEGLERTERPETYKQWQARTLRAGFVQNPLNQDMLKKAKERVKNFYHKDFNVDESSGWLLQGWKGRIVYGLSSWSPNNV